MKKAMKCMAGILALTLAFAQVAPVSAFAEETTAATEEAAIFLAVADFEHRSRV